MSGQSRRRLRASPAPRRVGEPNVLSNQATPNRLSTMGTPGRSVAPTGPAPEPASSQARSRPRVAAGGRTPEPTDASSPRRRSLPSLGTILTVGFVLFWVARFLGNAGVSLPGSTTAPLATTQPRPTLGARPTIDSSPGNVVFGESITEDGCDLINSDTRFQTGRDIWWQAEMTRVIGADESVVYVAKRDDVEIDRETVPPDPEVGEWQILCAGRAVPGSLPGSYRVEIWDADQSVLLSAGEYTKFDPRATPSPKPTSSPRVTAAAGTVGQVVFGTSLGDGCTLGGQDTSFHRGFDVWWRAELLAPQPADADVLGVTLQDDRQIGRELITTDRTGGPWTVVCARNPSPGITVGSFSVEVWDEQRTTLLATGAFTRLP